MGKFFLILFIILALVESKSKLTSKLHKDYFYYSDAQSCIKLCLSNGGDSLAVRMVREGPKYNCCPKNFIQSSGRSGPGGFIPGSCKQDFLRLENCTG